MNELEFFENPNGSGNLLAFVEGGLVVVKAGISIPDAVAMLESGDKVKAVEGEYQGKPSTTYLVGWAGNGTKVAVKGITAHKSSPRAKITITLLD